MALWAWNKLLSLFTPEEVRNSHKLVAALSLPPNTSQFLHAFSNARDPASGVVYLLAVEKLSERSVADVHAVVRAARPNSVVALVDSCSIDYVLDEEKFLEEPNKSLVPSSALKVVIETFLDSKKEDAFESRAGIRFLASIFGTTIQGNIIAAKKVAGDVQATFEYLCVPSTAISSLAPDPELKCDEKSENSAEEKTSSSFVDRFLNVLGSIGGDGTSVESGVSGSQMIVPAALPISKSFEFKQFPPSISPLLFEVALPLTSQSEESSAAAAPEQVTPEGFDADTECPSFASPIYPLFVDLHNLFAGKWPVNQALGHVQTLLKSIDNGESVNPYDLAQARAFRIGVECIRVHWNSYEAGRGTIADFSQLSYGEKCCALLAQGLKHQGEKCGVVVAVVDAEMVSGIRKHWNTPVPPEVLSYAEHCFLPVNYGDGSELGPTKTLVLEKPEARAAVVVGAGAVAAVGVASLPSISTAAKIVTFQVPTMLKVVFLQTKRTVLLFLAKTISPASNLLVPAFQSVGYGKVAAVGQSGAVKSMALKGALSAEKARIAAQTMVAAAERASLQAVRTAFYSLMKHRQVGPRSWIVLAGTLAAATGVVFYGEGIERAISIAPNAPTIARLGQGIHNLDQAESSLPESYGPSFWERIYTRLYEKKGF